MAIGTNIVGAAAGTITAGQRKLADIGADRKVPQWLMKTVNVSLDVAPLLGMIERGKGVRKEVGQATYFHLETDNLPVALEVNGAQTDADTSLEVTAGHGVRAPIGTILKSLRTGELLRVTARSTDTLTVTRGFGGTTAAALNDNEELAILSFADTEGNTSPFAQSSEPTKKANYVQTFRQSFELSGRDLNSDVYGDDELKRIQQDALQALKQKQEMAMFFQNGTNATDPTMTGGCENFITSNVDNIGGTLNEGALNDWIQDWMRRNRGQGNCLVFAGENFCRALDGFGRDAVRYAPNDTVLGLKVGGYRTSFGEIKIHQHGLFSSLGSGVAADDDDGVNGRGGWAGYAFGLNLNNIGKVTFRGRKLRLRADIQTPDTDGRKFEYLEDCGLYLANEKSHALMYGITG